MKGKILIISIIVFQIFFIAVQILEAKIVQEYFKEAERYYKAGYDEMGDQVMQEAIKKYPTDRYVLRYKGMKLFAEGKTKESYEVFQEAVKYNPDYGEGYWFLGMAERDFDNDAKAEEYFKKAIELDPKTPAHADLGGLYFDKGKYEDAITEINLGLKYNKPAEGVYLVLGDSYTALGKYQEALEAYKNAQKIGEPTYYAILLRIGQTHEKLGEWLAAKELYTIALKWHKNDEQLLEGLKRTESKIKELGPQLEPKGPVLDYKGYKTSNQQPTAQ